MKVDLCIIGAGAAGLSLAAGASQLGASVMLIERHKMGGDCLHTGCVPSKAFLAAAKHRYTSLNSPQFGFHIQKSQLNFHEVIKHVKNAISSIEPHDSVERFEGLGCEVIQGHAEFVDENTIKVKEKEIKAVRFVIACGSTPYIPPIVGLNNVPFFTNETIFDIGLLPKHLLIIGGGPIACELGQGFAMLGAKVSILARSEILSKDEVDCVDVVRQSLVAMGVKLYEQISIESIAELNHRLVIVAHDVNQQELVITGSEVLIATGRTPNTADLNIANAGIHQTKQGIVVDERLRTSNQKVFAIGDVIGQHQFTHMANYHAGIVLKNCLFRWPAKANTIAVPWVTYTTPEIAHVGLTTKQAIDNNINISITEHYFIDNDRAVAEGQTQGKIKVITDLRGRVLGVSIVGVQAGELIMPWLLMVQKKQSLKKMTEMIVPYPTLSEINKRVAGKFFHDIFFSTKVKKIVQWLKVT